MARCAACNTEYEGELDACPACGATAGGVACETHPDREATGRCVVCGRPLCPECRADGGRAFLCERHRSVNVIEGWAQAYSTTSEVEAQLICDNLRAEGIEARIFSQRDRAFSLDLGELSIVRLLVPVWEYEPALEVIRSHMDTSGEVAFACPSCGEPYAPGASECAACGAALD